MEFCLFLSEPGAICAIAKFLKIGKHIDICARQGGVYTDLNGRGPENCDGKFPVLRQCGSQLLQQVGGPRF